MYGLEEGKNFDLALKLKGSLFGEGLADLERRMKSFGLRGDKPMDLTKFLPWLARRGGSLLAPLESWTSMSALEQKVFLKSKMGPVLRALAEFEKRKMGDIQKVASLEDLIGRIKAAGVGAARKKEFTEKSRTILKKNDLFVAFTPDRHCAAQKYGKGTKWCVTQDNPHYFRYYSGLNGEAEDNRLVFVMRLTPKGDDLDKIGVAFNLRYPDMVQMFDASDKEIGEGALPNSEFVLFKRVVAASKNILVKDKESPLRGLENLAANRDARMKSGRAAAKKVLSPRLEKKLQRDDVVWVAEQFREAIRDVEGRSIDADGDLISYLKSKASEVQRVVSSALSSIHEDLVEYLYQRYEDSYGEAVDAVFELWPTSSKVNKLVSDVIDQLGSFEYDSITDWSQSYNNAQDEYFNRLRDAETRIGFVLDDMEAPGAEMVTLDLMKALFKHEGSVFTAWDGLVGGAAVNMFKSSYPISPQRNYNEPKLRDVALDLEIDRIITELNKESIVEFSNSEPDSIRALRHNPLARDERSALLSKLAFLPGTYLGREDKIQSYGFGDDLIQIGSGEILQSAGDLFTVFRNKTVPSIAIMVAAAEVAKVAKKGLETIGSEKFKEIDSVGKDLFKPLEVFSKSLKTRGLEWLRPYANKGVI